jgi:putative transposase
MRQCELIGVSRSGYYYTPAPESPETIDAMNRIDRIYTTLPYYGSPKIYAQLRRDGLVINHKKVERLMRVMGIQGIHPKKNTSKASAQHLKFPYLLKNVAIIRPNQVWGTDITYIRARGIWFYLVAIIDWFSRYVIAWQLSSAMTVDFCSRALTDALAIAVPEIHNSDQGSQFTSDEYVGILKSHPEIQISMDGRGRCFDNIFTERLWRTVKYEEVYLREYLSYHDVHQSLKKYFSTYNAKRLHQSLGYRTPAEVYFQGSFSENPEKLPSTIAYTLRSEGEVTSGSSQEENLKVEALSMN